MDKRDNLEAWYDEVVRQGREFLQSLPTEPERYQQRFYFSQAFRRFRDYWEDRVREEKRKARPSSR